MGGSRMEPPAQHSGSITFCLAGNPNLTYERRHCTLTGCTGGAMDTGAHALTCTGALLAALSFAPWLYPTEYLSPTHATSTASSQIPAVNDRAREQRKAIQLHSQTLGTVSLFPVLHESGRFWSYCSGLSLRIY